MTDSKISKKDSPDDDSTKDSTPRVNLGYVIGQLIKSQTGNAEEDKKAERCAAWERVIERLKQGQLIIGSRNPDGKAEWLTRQVMTGGFTTGALLAGGEPKPHERRYANAFVATVDNKAQQMALSRMCEERMLANSLFVTTAGKSELRKMLRTGRYRIYTTEEGAFMTAIWFEDNGMADEAAAIYEAIMPYFGDVRFFPEPSDKPEDIAPTVFVNSARNATIKLAKGVPPCLQRQVDVTTGFIPKVYDPLVGIVCKTRDSGWPFQTKSDTLTLEFSTWLDAWETTFKHKYGGLKRCCKGNFVVLLRGARAFFLGTGTLTPRLVGLSRRALADIEEKRGLPDSERAKTARSEQYSCVENVDRVNNVRDVMLARLEKLDPDRGIPDVADVVKPFTADEALKYGVAAGEGPPKVIRKTVSACRNATLRDLLGDGTVPSGEALASIIGPLVANAKAAAIADRSLRRLYILLLRAFDQRRSLLLLNLQTQVKFADVPWCRAIMSVKDSSQIANKAVESGVLREVVAGYLRTFPQTQMPNKLIQALNSLCAGPDVDCRLQLHSELAADIFEHAFSPRFLHQAHRAATVLRGSAYAKYYGIDYGNVLLAKHPNDIYKMCVAFAGPLQYSVSYNGSILEWMYVISGFSLPGIFESLGSDLLSQEELAKAVRSVLKFVVNELQKCADLGWHDRLLTIKNSAYAWRQMVVLMTRLNDQLDVLEFFVWADAELLKLDGGFGRRFRPILASLANAWGMRLAGMQESEDGGVARPFLGWMASGGRHWLMDQLAM